ncbi:hypothetical protein Tco_0639868 [Tanacetum coccineum]
MNEEYYEQNSCYNSNSFGFDQFQLPQYTVNHPIFNAQNEFLNSQNKLMEQMTSICDMVGQIMQNKEEERRVMEEQAAKEDMSEKIDEEYERDCEIRIRKLKQDFNIWGSEVQKKEQAYNEEQYSAARRRMLSIPFVDEDDYIPFGDIIARCSTSKAITPDLPIEEPYNSLSMGDEHLDTTSSIENLVPIPSKFEGISDDTSDVPTCDNNLINVESDLVESLINRDTSIVYSSKIDPILEEFAGELAPIRPEMDEDEFDEEEDDCYDDDTSSDDDDFENIEYVDATPPNSELGSVEEVEDGELDQEGLIDNSNDPEFESFHFELEPSSLHPPPEPPNVCLSFKPNTAVKNDENLSQGVIVLPLNVEDVNSFTFVIWTFLPYFTYPEESPLFLSFRNEDLVFDPGISTFHFSLKTVPFTLPKDK